MCSLVHIQLSEICQKIDLTQFFYVKTCNYIIEHVPRPSSRVPFLYYIANFFVIRSA
jgi:hypothetical protein